eukprot:4305198-Prorocentrum_lima.AAC.1
MNDPGEPSAMWDSGASPFLLPLTYLPKNASGTIRTLVRLAAGDTEAIYWKDAVPYKERRTPSFQPR